jgi:site-specific DNA recombinase
MLVRKIYKMYLHQKSMPQVAFDLNEDRILTKNRKRWTAATIREILTNKIYIGVYEVAGIKERVEDYRILDDSIFAAAETTRFRYRQKGASKPPVPAVRRIAGIEQVFEKYARLLEEVKER